MCAIYAYPKPCIYIYIYGCNVYVFSLYLAAFMHLITCIYVFGHVASCRPTSLLPPVRQVDLDFMQKKGLNAMVQGGSGLTT